MKRRRNYGAGKAYLLRKGKKLSHKIFSSRGGIRL